ncbi:MAG: SMI1/KNR4 family protein [Thermogemmata sp.]|jgi:cell wall assembly regulator SMI1
MKYTRLFDTVRRHLERLGVACEIEAGKVATAKAVARIEAKIQVRLPAELREFYQTMGDGFLFRWQTEPEDHNGPFASLWVPTLDYLASMYTGWRKIALYSPEESERYGFPGTKDPALAKRTAARMWHWLPVLEQGNGDMICLDLGDPGCPVVFDKHDWMDGGTGDNGHVLAPNWRAFLIGWGSVCFQHPKYLYWPFCFREGGGVAWDGDQFRDPYRIPALAEASAAADRSGG